jgi:hypothetical protein
MSNVLNQFIIVFLYFEQQISGQISDKLLAIDDLTAIAIKISDRLVKVLKHY